MSQEKELCDLADAVIEDERARGITRSTTQALFSSGLPLLDPEDRLERALLRERVARRQAATTQSQERVRREAAARAAAERREWWLWWLAALAATCVGWHLLK